MESAVLIVLLALAQFTWFSVRVGIARGKYGVDAPKTTGNEIWERLYRVQQNTMEQLVLFIPAMLAFNVYLSARWALIPGVVFLAGRQLYSWEYISRPTSRTPGMALTLLANAVLLAGALVGVGMKVF
ncbi:MAG: MAPEG family protein [Xanthomonadales bacterium]|nr:MAPEG family protein [Xanthomonadales bacterium]